MAESKDQVSEDQDPWFSTHGPERDDEARRHAMIARMDTVVAQLEQLNATTDAVLAHIGKLTAALEKVMPLVDNPATKWAMRRKGNA